MTDHVTKPLSLVTLSLIIVPVALSLGTIRSSAQQVTFPASDGATVHGTWHRSDNQSVATIIAFHQGGASGEAEYSPIIPRLHAEGFDVLVIDQRAGGNLFGGVNRTVAANGESTGFCEAAPDLEGALRYARNNAPDMPIILWGSSYSGALVLRLAASNPDGVAGVLAFSPASGGPMAVCRGEDVSDRIRVPTLTLRPLAEMERESSVQQFAKFQEQGHETYVADPGTHGSSMLVEERVESSVADTWNVVSAFLERVTRRPIDLSMAVAPDGIAYPADQRHQLQSRDGPCDELISREVWSGHALA